LDAIVAFRERLEDDGMRYKSGSPLKSERAAGEYTARVRKDMVNLADQSVAALRDVVGARRGLSEDQLDAAFSGRTFVGQQAVDAGLLDGVFDTMDAALASLDTQEKSMSKDTSVAAPAPTATQAAPTEAAATNDEAAAHIGRRFLSFLGVGGDASASPPPAAAPAATTENQELAALRAKMEQQDAQIAALQAQAAESKAAATRAEVARELESAGAVPAYAVEALTKAMTAETPEDRAAALAEVKALPAAAGINPSGFGDLPAGAPAQGVRYTVPTGCTVDHAEAAEVAKISAEHAGDPRAEMAALLKGVN
jgi:hypothetical protein